MKDATSKLGTPVLPKGLTASLDQVTKATKKMTRPEINISGLEHISEIANTVNLATSKLPQSLNSTTIKPDFARGKFQL